MFEEYAKEWLHAQISTSRGERKRRSEDQRHAESVFFTTSMVARNWGF